MRMETNTERYDGFEQIFDGVQECPVDTEYTLPDYCADIQKILKCIVTPEVMSVSTAGDSLTIDGCASMHVLYLDAKGGCVRGFDTKKEFTCSVRLRAQAENVTAEAEPFVQHMTCRAMNARRVDLHITLGLSVRAYAVRQLEIADCISDDRVETKCEEYDVTRAVGCVMHAFILEQNAELPNGKSPIETVLRCSVRYQIDTVQPQAGGAVVTGKACVEILYRTFSDTAMPERFSCILPFTQTVECAGAGEDCTIQISVLGGECTVQPREDSVGEYTVLNLYLKPTFCVQFTKSCTVRTVCDAYSIKGAWAAKYKNLSLERCEVLPPRSVRVKENVLADGVYRKRKRRRARQIHRVPFIPHEREADCLHGAHARFHRCPYRRNRRTPQCARRDHICAVCHYGQQHGGVHRRAAHGRTGARGIRRAVTRKRGAR